MSKKATLEVKTLKLKDVKPNTQNPRLHSQEQIRKLQHSLGRFGYAAEIK